MGNLKPSEHARRIHATVQGEDQGFQGINTEVIRSWERCLNDYHLDPERRRPPVVLSREDLEERQEKLSPLLAIAKAEMTNLYQQVAGSGYAILLTDVDGVVLNYVGDPQFTDAAMRNGLHVGAVWSEADQGTNGMGTCIVEQKPLIIHQDDHFLVHHTGLTCSAAPIRDPSGNMMAVLDASSESRMAQQHTMALVKMSAQMIENRLFLCAFKDHFIVRFHSRPEFVSTLGEGALALDHTGAIRGANRSALFQLGRSYEELCGLAVESVFKESMPMLIDMARRQFYHPVPLHSAEDGRRFFGIMQLPAGGEETCRPVVVRGETRAPAPPGGADLDRLDLGDPIMARNIRRAKKLIDRNIPLLLYGETGTGKGMFAKAFHDASARRDKPFVAVNCASIPETLIESELFGYKPGAFTGANRRGSRGKILQADGGTLFLDEIGDMPLHLQARLLRVLEEKEVVPLGGETPERVDIAIISATHRDLTQLIAEGQFREDLYYRLHGIALTMPPLRERKDRRALINDIVAREASEGESWQIDEQAMELLLSYDWPGNIRQLCNTLRAVMALCDDFTIHADDLPDELRRGTPLPQLREEPPEARADDPLGEAERTALLNELESMRWNVAKVARKLNLSRNTLYRKMKRHGIRPPR